MKIILILCGLVVAINIVECRTVVKREAGDISPLNEIYLFETDDQAVKESDDEHGDRDKRKIGIIKLGVSNGIINFVFGKLDSFLDAKTKALGVLDESNKAKNAIYGIDPHHSATSAFISDVLGKKLQAGTASIGPLINSATTFISSKGQGLLGTLTSKLAPLSSLSGGLSGGAGGDHSGGGGGGGSGGILSLLTSLSGSSSSGLSGGSGGSSSDDDDNNVKDSSDGNGGGGISLGSFPSIGGGGGGGVSVRMTNDEDIPEFDRNKVSLDVPPEAFGTGFTVVTGITKLLNKLILNTAHRTESVLEVFKPIFRGAFAIKGLPSDKNNNNINDNYIKVR